MANPQGGYVITGPAQKKQGQSSIITPDKLKEIAHLLGVDDVTDIRTIFVYAPRKEL